MICFPRSWAPSNCLPPRPTRDFGSSAVRNMKQEWKQLLVWRWREAHWCGVVSQGQPSVFPGWLSQWQQWGDVGGINLANFTIYKWDVCLRLVVQDLSSGRLGSVDLEQLSVGTDEQPPMCHPAHLSGGAMYYPPEILISVHSVKRFTNA